jgi:hypothetical protein
MRPRGLGRILCAMLGSSALAMVGCNDPAPIPATDAGGDTGITPTDGGRDSGPGDDGGLDSGVDGGGVDSGTDAAPPVDGGPPPMARTLPTNGSAVVLSADDSVMVACNREAGSISVFSVSSATPPVVTRTAEFDVADAEPWAAVIGNDDDTAYVILRATGEIVRIDDLDGTPALATFRGTVGSEPTGLAISPLGGTLWVANWSDGTLMSVNPHTLAVGSTVDLNDMLVDTGSLGTVTARPGLAHPRAITITNNGDTNEFDESIYVTEYYGQARTDTLPTDDTRFDLARRGIVYRLDALGVPQESITIAPVADTGFLDSTGATTGCFPNQLLATTVSEGRVYVTGLCESPRGPTGPILDAATNLPVAGPTGTANFKTQIHSTVWVIDTTLNEEDTSQRVLLPRAFQAAFDGTTPITPDDGVNRRIPLIPNDIAFVPGSTIAYLTSYGSDAVFRIQYEADGSLNRVGSPATMFINLAPTGMPAGRLPYGIAIGHTATGSGFAHVVNEATRNVSLVGFGTQALLSATASTDMPVTDSEEAHVLEGRRFFVTGLGRWSFRGQGWNSCESCHGDGLTDTVTWYFARGPRQSTSLDGTFDSTDPTQQRLLNWTAIFDEVHDFELNTRGNSGGVGAVVHTASTPPVGGDRILFDGTTPVPAGQMPTPTPQAGLNGSVNQLMPDGAITPHSVLPDWDRVEAYIQSIRTPNAPSQLSSSATLAADVTAGAALFALHNCAGCHGTSMWTISRRFWAPGEITNHPATGTLRTMSYTAPALFPAALNPPSSGAGRTATLRFPAGATAGANDQIQCVLRSVGTFPTTGTTPVVIAGSPVQLAEVRADMVATAQGLSGFNPPSLLGLGSGAPYFHGGNARTLEEVFDPAFTAHYQAMSVNFLTTPATRATEVRQMVAYLLSIDESTAPLTVPAAATLGYNPLLCPATL